MFVVMIMICLLLTSIPSPFVSPLDVSRRSILAKTAAATSFLGVPAAALSEDTDSFNSRVNKLVTKSELGLEVRRSVVKGAQVLDGVDGWWEKFSDRNGLGSARKQQSPYPTQSTPPLLAPLNSKAFDFFIEACDAAFLQAPPSPSTSRDTLTTEIERIRNLVKPSFDRMATPSPITLEAYCRFRAYSSLWGSSSPSSSSLKRAKSQFSLAVGSALLNYLNVNLPSTPTLDSCSSTLLAALDKLTSLGFLARATLSDLTDFAREDFADGLDTTLTVAVDTDIFQESTILLNEQGFRLFTPSVATFLAQSIYLLLPKTTTDVTEYFMDTAYSSDPDKFEVRQVLVNIELKQ